jgi:RNA recognition motif-containing protein
MAVFCLPHLFWFGVHGFLSASVKGLSSMATRLYVGNLPWSISSSDLQTLFAEYGGVDSAEVISDRVTGRSRGFGFVQMDSEEASQSAIENLNGREVSGRAIVVNEARERTPRSDGGRFRHSR